MQQETDFDDYADSYDNEIGMNTFQWIISAQLLCVFIQGYIVKTRTSGVTFQ